MGPCVRPSVMGLGLSDPYLIARYVESRCPNRKCRPSDNCIVSKNQKMRRGLVTADHTQELDLEEIQKCVRADCYLFRHPVAAACTCAGQHKQDRIQHGARREPRVFVSRNQAGAERGYHPTICRCHFTLIRRWRWPQFRRTDARTVEQPTLRSKRFRRGMVRIRFLCRGHPGVRQMGSRCHLHLVRKSKRHVRHGA